MIQEGSNVKGINMDGKEIEGRVETIAGFGKTMIVRTGEDRLDLTFCDIDKIKEIEK